MSLKKQALSGVMWSLVQQFSTQGIAFIVSIILARLLLPEEFGLIAMIGVFMGLGRVLSEAGLAQSLIRTTNPTDDDYTTVFYFNLTGSCIVYLIIFTTAPFIADFYHQPSLISLIRWYCSIFIINAFSSIQYTRLTKQMLFKKELSITVPSLIISSVVGVTMAFNGYGVWSLVASAIAQSLSAAIQLWYRSDWEPTWTFNKEKFKYHFNYGYKLTLSGILDNIFSNAYTIIIGKFFAPAQVGFYNRADTLKQLPVSNISAVLTKVTFPLFAEIKNDDIRLKAAYKNIMQMVIFFVSPILLILSAIAEPLFSFLFTEKWIPAVPYFQILCWNGILFPIHSYNLNILKVKGRSDLFLKLEIIKKAMILVIIAVSFQFGIYGLLYGSVLTSVLAFFINTHYTGKFLNYNSLSQLVDLLPAVFVGTISSGIVYGADFLFKDFLVYDILRLITGCSLGALFYLSIAYAFKMTSLLELIKIIKRQ
ncbi:lipopolysaccharide biosynthesis protein [Flavobacterium glaciei]|uniref:O-antigen/teichoic acid export membrane protein n=1 Tax=Flavobacterium glaciei TaxID=386300 RepID=A0A562Q616_9FLAO|nr:lipopolysaccharide biosynthesis protein [Flavobacterium glaciei]RDI58379.1 O-antigen/teichoic acid export membrane protein [Flavobacterium glaciei]TWI52164.1 O-antigen/teichoic acid export membrane protein [Flavobacterium glaciei]